MNRYLRELIIGLLLAMIIVLAALALSERVPFVYQGF